MTDSEINTPPLKPTSTPTNTPSIPINTPTSNLLVIDHIYCINLDVSYDRRTHMKEMFSRLNLVPTFVRAVSIKHKEYLNLIKKPANKLKNSSGLRRCFCTTEVCEHKARLLRPVEIAINLSHYHVCRKIVKNEDYWAMVCEDDIRLHDNFISIINSVVPRHIWESDQPVMINCGGFSDNYNFKVQNVGEFGMEENPNGAYSNYCFLINQKAARVLLKYYFPIARPDDSFKRHLIKKGLLKCYRIRPSCVAELSAGRNAKPIYARTSNNKSLVITSSLAGNLREQSQPQSPIAKPTTTTQVKPNPNPTSKHKPKSKHKIKANSLLRSPLFTSALKKIKAAREKHKKRPKF